MTIVHLSSSFGIGGAAIMVLELAKQSKTTHRTIVFSISTNNTLENKFIENNIECNTLNITSFKNSSLFKGLKTVNQTIKKYDDVVFHCHQYHGLLLGLLYNLIYSNNPIVFTLHSSKVESPIRRILLFLTKPFRKRDVIFSKNAEKWYLKNSNIIPNGIDFKNLVSGTIMRSFNNTDIFNFLYLGRISNEKNPLFMVSAALELRKKNIFNFNFNVVGDGELTNELKLQIKNNDIENHFNLLGFKKNINPFLNQSQCLILPSFWEGMPVVIIEAAVVKLPVITTPVGSIPDFMSNKNGFVSELENFIETMVFVMNNYDLAIQKAEVLYKDAENSFDIKNVFRQHLLMYNSIISKS